MQKHKWYNEIVAWASGAEIEYFSIGNEEWVRCAGNRPSWHEHEQYRIKPQPKEPQYLYVYTNTYVLRFSRVKLEETDQQIYVGKIKLEVEDGQ